MNSYEALYRKYRSQTFADLVGQEAISRALQGALVNGRVSHAYLFSGSRGTGKTTSARLLAKALNCSRRPPGSAEPCNGCESCLSVSAGSALDLIEIDAASNRGIDEIRDLREKVRLAPALGGYKVYIIDEAHMLTTEAFNALLKTLEEPPDHVVFVLCTTEAEKVPLTVRGRCAQFRFGRHTEPAMVGHLAGIARREGLDVDPLALALIARMAEGSMRDAIGYLDQVAPLAAGRITVAIARELLGVADPAAVAALFDAVLEGRAGDAMTGLNALYEGGVELRPLVRGLMESCRDLLVASIERRDTSARARLSGALDALLRLDGEVRRHAEPRFLVEATLVRLAVEVAGSTQAAAAVPAAPAPIKVVEPTDATSPGHSAGSRPAPVAPAAGAFRGAARMPGRPGPPESETSAPETSELETSELETPAPAPTELGPQAPALPAPFAAEGAPVADPDPVVLVQPVAGRGDAWQRTLADLPASARAIFKAGEVTFEGSTVVLTYRYQGQFGVAESKRGEVLPLLPTYHGPDVKLDIRLLPLSDRGVPARPIAPEEDPRIVQAVKTFGARVIDIKEIHQ